MNNHIIFAQDPRFKKTIVMNSETKETIGEIKYDFSSDQTRFFPEPNVALSVGDLEKIKTALAGDYLNRPSGWDERK